MHVLSSFRIAGLAGSMLALALSPAIAQNAKARLKNTEGKEVGIAALVQVTGGVLISLSVDGLPAGHHAFHVHAIGKCEPPFTTAGGHFNPENKKHGMMSPDGHHAGDMPNLHIPAGGALTVDIVNDSITLEKGKPNSVYGPNGTALVIHAGKDDYKTDPTGDAGGRIACGVIE
jgi:Cu-Zn family superoxide dismutase